MDVPVPFRCGVWRRSPVDDTYICALVSSAHPAGGGAPAQRLAASLGLAGGAGATVVLDAETLKDIQSLPSEGGSPQDLSFVPGRDAQELLVCGGDGDGAVRLWDLRMAGANAARVLSKPEPTGDDDELTTAAVSADGTMVACGIGPEVRLFDVGSGKALITHTEAHSQSVTRIRFHPHRSRELVTSGDDGLLCVLDLERCLQGGKATEDDAGLRVVVNSGENVRGFSFTGEDSDVLSSISGTEVVRLWSLSFSDAGSVSGQFPELRSHSRLRIEESDGYVVDVFRDEPTGRSLALAGSVEGDLSIFSLHQDGTASFAGQLPRNSAPGAPKGHAGHTGVVRCAALLGGSTGSFATAGEDGAIGIWLANPGAIEAATAVVQKTSSRSRSRSPLKSSARGRGTSQRRMSRGRGVK